MGYTEDIKYIGIVSNLLEGFKQKSSELWNFRCPFCGDSEKNSNKKRGYIYRKETNFVFHCHNCGLTKKLSKFLYDIDRSIYNDYKKESCLNNISVGKSKESEFKIVRKLPSALNNNSETKKIIRVTQLSSDHSCIKYIKSRQIPEASWSKLFWCQDFKFVVKELFGDKYEGRDFPDEGLLFKINALDGVFPAIAGIQLRSIDKNCPKSKRFVTCVEDNWLTAFGYEGTPPRFVVEGPIDSLFLPNCIASINASLWRVNFPDAIYINDCEPRNPQVVKQIKKCIDKGLKVTLLPEQYSGMDINDIVQNFGYGEQELISLIENNTYQGMTAKMKFATWKLS